MGELLWQVSQYSQFQTVCIYVHVFDAYKPWIYQCANNHLADTTCDMVIGSESLHFLPEPSRVLSADRGFDYNYGGVGKKESKLKRAAYAIPLFVILIAAIQTTPFYPLLTKDAKITWHNISNPFLKYLPTDGKQLALLTPILSDYDSNAKLEAIIYASTLLPLLAVWWIESIRRANTFTFAEYA